MKVILLDQTGHAHDVEITGKSIESFLSEAAVLQIVTPADATRTPPSPPATPWDEMV